MTFLDQRTVRVLTTTLLFFGCLAILYVGRRTFVIFLFAVFFAYLIEPVVAYFARRLRGSRGAAIATVYGIMVLLLIVLGASVGSKITAQGRRLAETLPDLLGQVQSGEIVERIGGRYLGAETETWLKDFLATHQQVISTWVQSASAYAGAFAEGLGWIVLIPILALFFLKERGNLGNDFLDFFANKSNRRFIAHAMNDLDAMLGTYIRAQIVLAIFAFIAYAGFLLIIGFPYSFAIATIASILELIPFVGPLVTAIIVLGMATLTGYGHWLVLIIFLVSWRIIQDYVNVPMLFRRGLELHPLMVMFAVMLGGELGGVIGMFLGIPTIAAIRLAYHDWVTYRNSTDAIADDQHAA